MKMSPHQVPTLMIVLILVISCFGCTMSDTDCTPGEARLVNGTSDNDGVLEICLSNSNWSTVCYDYLGCNDFLVACRQAGFDNVLSWNRNYTAYRVSKPEVGFYRCDGTENTLVNCTQRQYYTIQSHCYYRSVVTLTCTKIPDDASCDVEYGIRLYGGKNSSEGQLQMCRNKRWNDVCPNGNIHTIGHLACRELGYEIDDHWIAVTANGHFYATNSTWSTKYHFEYQRLYCWWYESRSLGSSCHKYTPRGSCSDTCYGSEVAVTCMTPEKTNCKEKDIRLVGGRTKLEGYVEVCVDGIWGRVSGKIEGRAHNVICSTLGYNDTGNQILSYWNIRHFTSTHSPRMVNYINCCDRDKTFSTCDIHYAKKTDRTSNDIAIRCVDGCTHGRMRLSGGDTEHEGNVEVCVGGTWRGVGLSEWDEVDANVVCQHLYPGKKCKDAYAIATNSTVFEGSSRAVYYDQLECGGAETSIYNCNKQQQSSILTGPTAAVYCKPLCDCK